MTMCDGRIDLLLTSEYDEAAGSISKGPWFNNGEWTAPSGRLGTKLGSPRLWARKWNWNEKIQEKSRQQYLKEWVFKVRYYRRSTYAMPYHAVSSRLQCKFINLTPSCKLSWRSDWRWWIIWRLLTLGELWWLNECQQGQEDVNARAVNCPAKIQKNKRMSRNLKKNFKFVGIYIVEEIVHLTEVSLA
jgi:hypothetical protein